jgi:isopentenyl phosphate kinase
MYVLYGKSNDLAKNNDLLSMTIDESASVLCIKIGGSVITDKAVAYKANREAIRSIAKTLKSIKMPLLIGHGSGSFGHTSAAKYGGKNGYTDAWGIAKVARDAQEINRIVMDIFIEEKLPAISFSPRSFLLTKSGALDESFCKPIVQALEQGLIPVIYGDVIWDRVQKTTIFSGETTLNLLCRHLQRNDYSVSKVIQLCNVDGVMDDERHVIPEITKNNWEEMQAHIKNATVVDVTGGMRHKVEDALALSVYGIETFLMNGNSKELLSIVRGKGGVGTTVR